MKSIISRSIFQDIRFWICVFFLLRLYGITNPPLEVAHNWRQTTGTMVTRNFLEESNNIFYPRIDFAGDKTGITGMEFPIHNYIDYLISEVFGYEHWYGRLVNLLVSSLGIWFFYLIIKRYFTLTTARNATLILLSSIWFAYSRKIMPDTFATSLVIIGFYYGCKYFEEESKKVLHLLLCASLTCLGILAKLPTGFLLVLYVFFLFKKRFNILDKLRFFIVGSITLTPVIWWYFSWVPYLVEKYEFWHFFMGKSLSEGSKELLIHWRDALKHFYDAALKYIGFAAFLVGIFFTWRNKNKLLSRIIILGFLSFSIIAMKAGFTFTHHSYYIIPFVPIMALIAGFGIAQFKQQGLQLVFLVLIAVEGIGNQLHDFRIKEHEMAFTKLEAEMDQISAQSDLIVVNTAPNPTAMYFAHRKGWLANNDELLQDTFRKKIAQKGCKYIVVLKRYLGGDLTLDLPICSETIDWTIYKLENQSY